MSPPTRTSMRSGSARNRRLLPGKEEADIAGHSSRVLEDLRPEVEAERSQMVVPELIGGLGPAFQGLFPIRFRVVDPSATIGAQRVRKAVHLNFSLPGLRRPVNEGRDKLQHLLRSALGRLVKFLH